MVEKRPRHLFCFGLGYTAGTLARRLLRAGWTVAGTARSEPARRALARTGIEAHVFSREHPLEDAGKRLAVATHVLSSVPPDAQGDSVVDVHGGDLAAAPNLAWAGYLSTTGVYGDRGGAWVDEFSDLAPTTPRGRRRAAAEDRWLVLGRESGVPVHLFRLAGIYGPGASTRRASCSRGFTWTTSPPSLLPPWSGRTRERPTTCATTAPPPRRRWWPSPPACSGCRRRSWPTRRRSFRSWLAASTRSASGSRTGASRRSWGSRFAIQDGAGDRASLSEF